VICLVAGPEHAASNPVAASADTHPRPRVRRDAARIPTFTSSAC
jgi:hypothetical protein